MIWNEISKFSCAFVCKIERITVQQSATSSNNNNTSKNETNEYTHILIKYAVNVLYCCCAMFSVQYQFANESLGWAIKKLNIDFRGVHVHTHIFNMDERKIIVRLKWFFLSVCLYDVYLRIIYIYMEWLFGFRQMVGYTVVLCMRACQCAWVFIWFFIST